MATATTNATETEPAMGEQTTDRTNNAEPTTDELKAELDRQRAEKATMAAALKKANDEAKNRRHRLEELEAAEVERETASLGEAEKAKRASAERDQKSRDAELRADKAERALVAERIDRAVEREAADADFLYPGDAPKLIDRDRVEIDPETGKISGVKEAVAALMKQRPGLVKAKSGGGSPQAIRARGSDGGAGGGHSNGAEKPVPIEQQLRGSVRYP